MKKSLQNSIAILLVLLAVFAFMPAKTFAQYCSGCHHSECPAAIPSTEEVAGRIAKQQEESKQRTLTQERVAIAEALSATRDLNQNVKVRIGAHHKNHPRDIDPVIVAQLQQECAEKGWDAQYVEEWYRDQFKEYSEWREILVLTPATTSVKAEIIGKAARDGH